MPTITTSVGCSRSMEAKISGINIENRDLSKDSVPLGRDSAIEETVSPNLAFVCVVKAIGLDKARTSIVSCDA